MPADRRLSPVAGGQILTEESKSGPVGGPGGTAVNARKSKQMTPSGPISGSFAVLPVAAATPSTPLEYVAAVAGRFAEMTALQWFEFGIAFALLVGGIKALTTYRASWRGDADPSAANSEMLIAMRELTRTGEISEEEYRSVKGLVAGTTSPASASYEPDDTGPATAAFPQSPDAKEATTETTS